MLLPHEICNYASQNFCTSSFDMNVVIKYYIKKTYLTAALRRITTKLLLLSHTCTVCCSLVSICQHHIKIKRVKLEIKFRCFQNMYDLHVEKPSNICLLLTRWPFKVKQTDKCLQEILAYFINCINVKC